MSWFRANEYCLERTPYKIVPIAAGGWVVVDANRATVALSEPQSMALAKKTAEAIARKKGYKP